MRRLSAIIIYLFIHLLSYAQITKAPDRKEGDGPWPQLILRGAILINGTGAPAIGPVDIVIENNRIISVNTVGYPGMPIKEDKRPKMKAGGKEIDCTGMYIMPGFIDMHGHIGGQSQGTTAEYVFKLWMAHGITTVRDPGSFNGLEWMLDQKEKSAKNFITAPRIYAFTSFGSGSKQPITTATQAIEWVRENAKKGADGIKFFGASPEVM
ncbi:MAG: amidohydrolase family protein, partial [Chitinophagaceae bacterium]